MSDLGLTTEQLQSIPALRDLDSAQLERVCSLFQRVEAKSGDALFEQGEQSQAFYLLVAGEVKLFRDGEETHRLRPPVLIGELGAVTGLIDRQTRAEVGPDAGLWQVDSAALDRFFEQEPAVAQKILRSMLASAGDKVNRDNTRLADMRRNLIRTQKQMKKMRDFLLESPDTVVSKPLHEILEGLIRQNRRANYRVKPPTSLAVTFCLDDRSESEVVQVSRTHVSFEVSDGQLPEAESRISGVLGLSGPEIPVCGRVLRTIDRRVDFELDLLMDEYAAILEGYLTRVQMLDALV